MKTLSILFSEPDMFSVVIDGVNVRIDRHPFTLVCCADGRKSIRVHCYNDDRFIDVFDGDIFQVEGFEYEVKTESCNHNLKQNEIICKRSQIEFPDCCGLKTKVAILKLAKEEEPKEPNILRKLITEIDEERKIGYNQAIDDVLKKYRQYESASLMISYKEIESLKKS